MNGKKMTEIIKQICGSCRYGNWHQANFILSVPWSCSHTQEHPSVTGYGELNPQSTVVWAGKLNVGAEATCFRLPSLLGVKPDQEPMFPKHHINKNDEPKFKRPGFGSRLCYTWDLRQKLFFLGSSQAVSIWTYSMGIPLPFVVLFGFVWHVWPKIASPKPLLVAKRGLFSHSLAIPRIQTRHRAMCLEWSV